MVDRDRQPQQRQQKTPAFLQVHKPRANPPAASRSTSRAEFVQLNNRRSGDTALGDEWEGLTTMPKCVSMLLVPAGVKAMAELTALDGMGPPRGMTLTDSHVDFNQIAAPPSA